MSVTDLERMLASAVSQGGADLHLIHGSAPVLRICGKAGLSGRSAAYLKRPLITRKVARTHMRSPQLLT